MSKQVNQTNMASKLKNQIDHLPPLSLKRLSFWIVRRTVKNYENINDLNVRSGYGSLEGWVSIIGNTVLFVIKISFGLMTKSVSLIADSIHTLADSVTSVVIIVGFKMAKKPSDSEHPFGHGRVEFIATLIVSVLLFVAGVELIEKSVHNIINPQAASVSYGIIFLISGTILIKEWMSRFAFHLGDMIDSKALKADALHHRTDVLATALVVVALIASRFGLNRVDGIMGVMVSLIIFYSAYEIGKEAISPLLGEAPDKETIKGIAQIAQSHEGVMGIHDIIYHKYGQTSIISLHLEVSDKEDVNKLHMLSEDVEEAITRKMGGMAVVHIDPINKDHPHYEAIQQSIQEIIDQDKRVDSFHELRIVGCKNDRCNVIFDISLEIGIDEQETYAIIRSIREKFKVKFPQMKTVIKAEPKYAFNV